MLQFLSIAIIWKCFYLKSYNVCNQKIYTILYSITVDLHQTVDNKENIAKFTNEYDKFVKAVKEENKQETLKELSELENISLTLVQADIDKIRNNQ